MVLDFSFHHAQFYVHQLRTLAEYKALEDLFTAFEAKVTSDVPIEEGRKTFQQIGGNFKDHSSSGQDVVEQLICGFGMRVIGWRDESGVRSVLLTSVDEGGAKYLVSAVANEGEGEKSSVSIFRRENIEEFIRLHNGKQGIAVLCFRVEDGGCEKILSRYQSFHPALVTPEGLTTYEEGGKTVHILEVYAYYAKEGGVGDRGTRIRFVESKAETHDIIPGLKKVEAKFPVNAIPFYSDHWVSNVHNREGFLKTLEDTLGFLPKVNFNAGVVGAGEAVIESTVTGNSPLTKLTLDTVLQDQSQVYLPINNALSPVGHVYLFLDQLGQGVQHLAARVPDMVAAIHHANVSREMTGHGFSFLRIPRSYYGTLTLKDLQASAGASAELASAVFQSLEAEGLSNHAGVVRLEITDADVESLPGKHSHLFPQPLLEEFRAKEKEVVRVVKQSRYVQLYRLLRDHIEESKYMDIVRNQILVDIQGNDILYQIFTASIMMEKAADEAPFIEFIERVCSRKICADGQPAPVRPGCGGFGIRNFLTLFLSIEVSKAMNDLDEARSTGDKAREAVAARMIEIFTEQMNESNPILTDISDAMTAEADILELLRSAEGEEKERLSAELDAQAKKKEEGQLKLKVTSSHYKDLMQKLRESSK